MKFLVVALLAAVPNGTPINIFTIGPSASSDPTQWFRQEDFPWKALQKDQHGIVDIDFSIDTKGRPVHCRTINSSGFSLLDKAPCGAWLKRGNFVAPRDDDGKAIPAALKRRFKFLLPDLPTAEVPAPGSDLTVYSMTDLNNRKQSYVVLRVIQKKNGEMESCIVEQSSSSILTDQLACKMAAPLSLDEPILDASGRPTRGARWRRIAFKAASTP